MLSQKTEDQDYVAVSESFAAWVDGFLSGQEKQGP